MKAENLDTDQTALVQDGRLIKSILFAKSHEWIQMGGGGWGGGAGGLDPAQKSQKYRVS